MTGCPRSLQESVVSRMVNKKGKKLFSEGFSMDRFVEDMDNVVAESVKRGDEEVKMNFGFLTE